MSEQKNDTNDITIRDAYVGKTLKQSFTVHQRIAKGGMSTLYEGIQQPIGRKVAIKVLSSASSQEEHLGERFRREAKVLGALNHPNILQIIDFGESEQGNLFIISELLQGKTLRQVVPKGRGLPLKTLFSYMEQMCAGIQAAHAKHLVHRDLKPSNIFICDTEDDSRTQVKVLDFGIVKPIGPNRGTSLTDTGVILGTAGYIAPEQFTSQEPADIRSDTYALGALFYFMIAGEEAFRGKNPQEIVKKQVLGQADPIDWKKCGKPAFLNSILRKALAKKGKDRYQDVASLIVDLNKAKIKALKKSTSHKNKILRLFLSFPLGFLLGVLLAVSVFLLWSMIANDAPDPVSKVEEINPNESKATKDIE